MAKRNRILLGVLVAAVLALLIALCFVGNTFARYTLKQSETVSASIAEWEVTVTEGDGTSASEEESVSVGTLQPLAAGYNDGEVTLPRTTEEGTNFVCVAKLTNTGDVSATVSVTADTTEENEAEYLDMSAEYDSFVSIDAMNARGGAYNISTTKNGQETEYGNVKEITEGETTSYQYVPGDDYGYAGTDTKGTEFAAEIAKHFTASLRWSYSTVDVNSNAITYDTANKFSYDAGEEETGVTDPTVDPAGSQDETANTAVYIWLDVEWLTDLSDGDTRYTNGDGFDTWAGTWVSAFTFGLTVEAYQAS